MPGGSHPYFQPWKDAGPAEDGAGSSATSPSTRRGWADQAERRAQVPGAQGYNAFGVFGVSPDNINSTFEDLKRQGFAVGSLASCPAGANKANFYLSTDVEVAAYKGAKAAINAMGAGQPGAPDRQQGRLQHPAPDRGRGEGGRRTGGKVMLSRASPTSTRICRARRGVADLLAAKGRQIQAIVNTAYNPAVASAEGVASRSCPSRSSPSTRPDGPRRAAGGRWRHRPAEPGRSAQVGSYALMKLSGGCTIAEPG